MHFKSHPSFKRVTLLCRDPGCKPAMSIELSIAGTAEGGTSTASRVSVSALPLTLWASQEALDRQIKGAAWVSELLSEGRLPEARSGDGAVRQRSRIGSAAPRSGGGVVSVELDIPHVCCLVAVTAPPSSADVVVGGGERTGRGSSDVVVAVDIVSGRPDEEAPSWGNMRPQSTASLVK